MAEYNKALPQPTPDTQPYWDGLKEHIIRMKRCLDCSKHHHYPRALCPHCGSTNLEWTTISGKGKLYTYTINHRPPRGWEEDAPYTVAIVEVDEGPRVMTTIVGTDADPNLLKPDSVVEPVFDDVTDDITLLKYKLS